MIPQKQYLSDARGLIYIQLTETVAAYIAPAQIQTSAEMEK